jgi:hypothetical protein
MLEWETPRLKSGYPHPGYRACSGDREYWLRSLNGADASPCRSPGLPGQQGLDLLLTQWKSPALSAQLEECARSMIALTIMARITAPNR